MVACLLARDGPSCANPRGTSPGGSFRETFRACPRPRGFGGSRVKRGGRGAFRRVTLTSGKKTLATVVGGEVDVEIAEGGAVAVEAPGEGFTILGGTPATHHGAWGDLRDRDEAQGLTRNVLPPYAPAELSVLTVEPGQHVEVYGVVLEETFAETETSMREAPSKHPSRMLAEIVAIADAPEDAMRAMTAALAERNAAARAREPPERIAPATDPADPRFRQDPINWIPAGIGALACAGLLVLAWTCDARVDAWRRLVVAVLWAAVAWSLRPTALAPSFYTRTTEIENRRFGEFMVRLLMPLALAAVSYNVLDNPRDRVTADHLTVGALVFVVAWMVSEFFWNRESHVLVARLAAGPHVALAQASGRSGSCEGVVATARPVTVAGARPHSASRPSGAVAAATASSRTRSSSRTARSRSRRTTD